MTALLENALEALRRLPPADQDEIARVILRLAGSEPDASVPLCPVEREAIVRSKAAAASGAFAADQEVRAVWARRGL